VTCLLTELRDEVVSFGFQEKWWCTTLPKNLPLPLPYYQRNEKQSKIKTCHKIIASLRASKTQMFNSIVCALLTQIYPFSFSFSASKRPNLEGILNQNSLYIYFMPF
jgi:hypothetical protein